MKTNSRFTSLAASALALLVFSALPAHAREWTSHSTGPRGGILDREVSRAGSQVDKSATYTSPAGKVSTRSAQRNYDKSTGTVTGSASTKRANGKTSGSSFTSVKTDTGRTTTGQATGANGGTATYDSTLTRNAGGFDRVATTTGPNGGSLTKDVDVTKQDGKVTRTATVTTHPAPKG